MALGTAVEERGRWLALLEEVFDPETIERLARLGVARGARVLEVGAGGGSIARWLARAVGPEGRVVATDVDIRFLDSGGQANLEVLEHDVLADDFPPESFDLIHCRAVLAHVADPEAALGRLVDWLRHGGRLLVEEPWTRVGTLASDPVAARAARALEDTAPRLDGDLARRLPQALADAGLVDVQADGRIEFFAGGSRPAAFFKHALAGAGAALVASGELSREELAATLERFDDPARHGCGWPRIAAAGRRAA